MELFAALHESAPGPFLRTLAAQQGGNYLGYSGRGGDVVSRAALACWVTRPTRLIVKVTEKNISRHLCGAQEKREVRMTEAS
jgi:hypothetical protein